MSHRLCGDQKWAYIEGGEKNGRQRFGVKALNQEQLAHGLGWFSIGLGLAEVAIPGPSRNLWASGAIIACSYAL